MAAETPLETKGTLYFSTQRGATNSVTNKCESQCYIIPGSIDPCKQRTVSLVLLSVYMHEALLVIFSWNLAFEV
jgi:hypothetical protein